MAPGARLALVCVDSLAGLGQAKDWVVGKGIPVVNHSLGWFNTWRGDGNGPTNTPDGIAADAHAHGVLWVNAAGNEARDHWTGTFTDSDANGWNDFAPANPEAPLDEGNSFPLAKGQEVCGYLKWDDWPASAQDYDLYLYREAPAAPPGDPAGKPTLIAQSTNLQSGTQPPTESICYTNSTSNALIGYDFAIRAENVTASPRLDLFVTFSPGPAPSLQYTEESGSLVEPAASTHVLSVGAACWVNSMLEPFSAQGPTLDGRIKPDITAPDGVSTATYGPSAGCAKLGVGFFGTSAAAPQVAGAAALMKQANPAFGPSELQLALESAAIDVGTPGKDPFYGSGILQLGATPPVPPAPAAPLAPPIVSGKAQQGQRAHGVDRLLGRLARLLRLPVAALHAGLCRHRRRALRDVHAGRRRRRRHARGRRHRVHHGWTGVADVGADERRATDRPCQHDAARAQRQRRAGLLADDVAR